jgi:NAD(P)-dependent dehydrogenase (short-subunit alcohol dehydrogenase family)
MFDFSGKVVIVTGGVGNLGSATARAFLTARAKIVPVDRSLDRLEETFVDLVGSPDHYLAGGVDLTDPASVQTIVDEVIRLFGRIDVLVNTVGGYRAGTPLHETPLDTLDFMFNLNARTVFIMSQAVIPHMLKQKTGKIVNVAARAGLEGKKNMAAYTAAKSAVIRLTESMSAELKTSGINVNCILPGTIDTPQNRADMPDANFSRWVAPEALADAILFLASDAARAVHGAALAVYGLS